MAAVTAALVDGLASANQRVMMKPIATPTAAPTRMPAMTDGNVG